MGNSTSSRPATSDSGAALTTSRSSAQSAADERDASERRYDDLENASVLTQIRAGYQELVNAIIRPPRAEYTLDDLGPVAFDIGGLVYRRFDFEVAAPRGGMLKCSHWRPEHDQMPKPCLIYLHGNSSSRVEAIPHLSLCLSLGITMAAFDFQGSGLSDGDYVSLGYFERDDLAAVIEHLRNSGTVSCIALWGRSMGAATALLHGDRDQTIAAMILDSAFADLTQLAEEMVEKGREAGLAVPAVVVRVAMAFIRRSVQRTAGFPVRDLCPLAHADRCFIPALFVAAKGDDFIRPHHSQQIYEAYGGDKNLVLVEGDHNSPRPHFLDVSIANFLRSYLRLPLPAAYADEPFGTATNSFFPESSFNRPEIPSSGSAEASASFRTAVGSEHAISGAAQLPKKKSAAPIPGGAAEQATTEHFAAGQRAAQDAVGRAFGGAGGSNRAVAVAAVAGATGAGSGGGAQKSGSEESRNRNKSESPNSHDVGGAPSQKRVSWPPPPPPPGLRREHTSGDELEHPSISGTNKRSTPFSASTAAAAADLLASDADDDVFFDAAASQHDSLLMFGGAEGYGRADSPVADPGVDLLALALLGEWECTKCTLINEAIARKCAVCGSRRTDIPADWLNSTVTTSSSGGDNVNVPNSSAFSPGSSGAISNSSADHTVSNVAVASGGMPQSRSSGPSSPSSMLYEGPGGNSSSGGTGSANVACTGSGTTTTRSDGGSKGLSSALPAVADSARDLSARSLVLAGAGASDSSHTSTSALAESMGAAPLPSSHPSGASQSPVPDSRGYTTSSSRANLTSGAALFDPWGGMAPLVPPGGAAKDGGAAAGAPAAGTAALASELEREASEEDNVFTPMK